MNIKNDIVYSLLLKPKDWTEEQQKLFVTIEKLTEEEKSILGFK